MTFRRAHHPPSTDLIGVPMTGPHIAVVLNSKQQTSSSDEVKCLRATWLFSLNCGQQPSYPMATIHHSAVPPIYTVLLTRRLLETSHGRNFAISYNGHMLENPNDAPPWTKVDHEVWFRDPRKLVKNMLANPDFNGEFDTTPFHEYDADNKHRFQNFMSGNWAWSQAVRFTSSVGYSRWF